MEDMKNCFGSNFNNNYNMNKVINMLNKHREDYIYLYVMTTIKYKEEENILCQRGSGPNFQGDIISLCTCKHYMRTFPDVKKGNWIAGFTRKNLVRNEDKNYMFYLARISHEFYTHHQIWNDKQILNNYPSIKLKNATYNIYGDIYEPKHSNNTDFLNWLDINNYVLPHPNHVHMEKDRDETWKWHKDITYSYKYKSEPRKLLFDPSMSFVWSKPMLNLGNNRNLSRGQSKKRISDIISMLQE